MIRSQAELGGGAREACRGYPLVEHIVELLFHYVEINRFLELIFYVRQN